MRVWHARRAVGAIGALRSGASGLEEILIAYAGARRNTSCDALFLIEVQFDRWKQAGRFAQEVRWRRPARRGDT